MIMLYYTSSSEHTRKLKLYTHVLIISIFLQFCVSLPPAKLISTPPPPPPRSLELVSLVSL